LQIPVHPAVLFAADSRSVPRDMCCPAALFEAVSFVMNCRASRQLQPPMKAR
jgi:hypothetical protein